MKKFKGEIYLILAAAIWGSAFLFQKIGMDFIGPFSFSAARFIIGSLALFPVIFIFDKLSKKNQKLF